MPRPVDGRCITRTITQFFQCLLFPNIHAGSACAFAELGTTQLMIAYYESRAEKAPAALLPKMAAALGVAFSSNSPPDDVGIRSIIMHQEMTILGMRAHDKSSPRRISASYHVAC